MNNLSEPNPNPNSNPNPNDDEKKVQNIDLELDIPRNFVRNIPETDGDEELSKVNSRKLRHFLISNIIQPNYISEVKDTMKWKDEWRRLSTGINWVSKIFLLFSTVFAAIIPSFPGIMWLPVSVIICNAVCGILDTLSNNASKESKISTNNLNKILVTLGIDGVPELEVEDKKTSVKMNIKNKN